MLMEYSEQMMMQLAEVSEHICMCLVYVETLVYTCKINACNCQTDC